MDKKRYKDRDWLYEKHVQQRLTNVEIADICDVSDGTICRWKDKLDICKSCHNGSYEFWHNSSVEEQLNEVGR